MHFCTISEIIFLVGCPWKSNVVLEKSLKNGCNFLYEPCDQLTAVIIGYLLTSATWLYWGLRCTTHYGGCFSFKVFCWPVMVFNGSQAKKTLLWKSHFFKVSIWAEVNFDENITSEKQFLEQTLWYNSLIRIDNCPVFYREWFDRGVTKVKHLKDEHNKFLSLAELQQKYSPKVCLLKYFGLVSALKSLWTTCKTNCIKNCDNYETFVVRLTECQSASKLVYTKLLSTKCELPSHNQQKWLKDCNENDVEAINWREAYQLAAKYTKSTRIIEFQYKFLHRRISTNDFLTKIGVKDNPNCSFCNNEPEKLLHLFWSCPKVAFFWHSLSLKLTLLHITLEHYTLDIFVALGLKPDSSKNCQQINFLFLLARNYIWISKRRETSPKIAGFLQYLKSFYHIETTADPILPKKWEMWAPYFSKPLILYTFVYLDPLLIFSSINLVYLLLHNRCLFKTLKI